MPTPLDDAALDQIFLKARTQNKWLDTPVSNEQLMALYDLMRWGPTSANSFPLRIVFVASPEAKQRLIPLVLEGVDGASYSDPGLRYQVLRLAPAVVSARRRTRLVPRQAGLRRNDRVPQQQPARRLLHHRGAGDRSRVRANVRLRQ
jgi:nitroreductase